MLLLIFCSRVCFVEFSSHPFFIFKKYRLIKISSTYYSLHLGRNFQRRSKLEPYENCKWKLVRIQKIIFRNHLQKCKKSLFSILNHYLFMLHFCSEKSDKISSASMRYPVVNGRRLLWTCITHSWRFVWQILNVKKYTKQKDQLLF